MTRAGLWYARTIRQRVIPTLYYNVLTGLRFNLKRSLRRSGACTPVDGSTAGDGDFLDIVVGAEDEVLVVEGCRGAFWSRILVERSCWASRTVTSNMAIGVYL